MHTRSSLSLCTSCACLPRLTVSGYRDRAGGIDTSAHAVGHAHKRLRSLAFCTSCACLPCLTVSGYRDRAREKVIIYYLVSIMGRALCSISARTSAAIPPARPCAPSRRDSSGHSGPPPSPAACTQKSKSRYSGRLLLDNRYGLFVSSVSVSADSEPWQARAGRAQREGTSFPLLCARPAACADVSIPPAYDTGATGLTGYFLAA